MLSSPGGQELLVPGLALWLIKIFVSLQQDGQADVILIPRLTQSRFVVGNFLAAHLFGIMFLRFSIIPYTITSLFFDKFKITS